LARASCKSARSGTDQTTAPPLAEIEKLWAGSSEAPKGDKLGILVTLVETYEERFFW